MRQELEGLRKNAIEPYITIDTPNGISLYLRDWSFESDSPSAILVLHGITAHSGPYSDIGSELTTLGYNVYGLDLRGHGLSEGTRGDYESYEELLEDFGAVLNYLMEKHEKIVLFGHSMGVSTSLIMEKHYSKNIAGLILLNGQIRAPKAIIPQYNLFEKLKIWIYSTFLPHKPIIEIELEEDFIDTDELFVFNYTTRFFKTMKINSLLLPEYIDKPVFVAVGEKDELWDDEEIHGFYKKLSGDDKKFVVISGARHAQLPASLIYDSGIADWLSAKFPSSNS